MTAPRLEGQMLALQRAYAQAGIRPSTVGLIEAHGGSIEAAEMTASSVPLPPLSLTDSPPSASGSASIEASATRDPYSPG